MTHIKLLPSYIKMLSYKGPMAPQMITPHGQYQMVQHQNLNNYHPMYPQQSQQVCSDFSFRWLLSNSANDLQSTSVQSLSTTKSDSSTSVSSIYKSTGARWQHLSFLYGSTASFYTTRKLETCHPMISLFWFEAK